MSRGSLDLTPIQAEEATAAFHQALMPHQVWSGPLPVCLAEHHQGKVRRLRLVLATLSHLRQRLKFPACNVGHIFREARQSTGLSMAMRLMRCLRRNGLSSQTGKNPDIGGYSIIALAVDSGAV